MLQAVTSLGPGALVGSVAACLLVVAWYVSRYFRCLVVFINLVVEIVSPARFPKTFLSGELEDSGFRIRKIPDF